MFDHEGQLDKVTTDLIVVQDDNRARAGTSNRRADCSRGIRGEEKKQGPSRPFLKDGGS